MAFVIEKGMPGLKLLGQVKKMDIGPSRPGRTIVDDVLLTPYWSDQ
jgi:hypothetical protein